jgi:hypothetical protein
VCSCTADAEEEDEEDDDGPADAVVHAEEDEGIDGGCGADDGAAAAAAFDGEEEEEEEEDDDEAEDAIEMARTGCAFSMAAWRRAQRSSRSAVSSSLCSANPVGARNWPWLSTGRYPSVPRRKRKRLCTKRASVLLPSS